MAFEETKEFKLFSKFPVSEDQFIYCIAKLKNGKETLKGYTCARN
jgi:hypothetical protein